MTSLNIYHALLSYYYYYHAYASELMARFTPSGFRRAGQPGAQLVPPVPRAGGGQGSGGPPPHHHHPLGGGVAWGGGGGPEPPQDRALLAREHVHPPRVQRAFAVVGLLGYHFR
jgi:hypothetical protein